MYTRVGCLRLCCHVVVCFDVVSPLFTTQSAVNSRVLIKQTFGETYSDRQHSGHPKLAESPLLMNTVQKNNPTHKR